MNQHSKYFFSVLTLISMQFYFHWIHLQISYLEGSNTFAVAFTVSMTNGGQNESNTKHFYSNWLLDSIRFLLDSIWNFLPVFFKPIWHNYYGFRLKNSQWEPKGINIQNYKRSLIDLYALYFFLLNKQLYNNHVSGIG